MTHSRGSLNLNTFINIQNVVFTQESLQVNHNMHSLC